MSGSNGNSLFAGIYSGLTNTYSYLAAQHPNQVTLENINKTRTDTNSANYLNQSFASYLETNFSNIDKDKDGIISANEMSELTDTLSTQGLTKEELTQLYSSGASGLSTSTMENILNNFDAMDTNHDGRITSAEISAYDLTCSRMKKEDEFNARKASDMSVFYGSEDSSGDSYSLLSYKYSNNKNIG